MAYDEAQAQRIRNIVRRRKGFTEKRMFGGVAFMMNDHMCCGIIEKDLVLRLGEEGAAEALNETHVRPMDFTGKPMKTMVYVAAAGIRSDESLRAWVDRAARFVRTLPPKK